MRAYLDTSLLVTALIPERRSVEVSEWLATFAEELVVSLWTVTEFASALSLKIRLGTLGRPDADAARGELDRLARESFVQIEVTAEDFRRAARFAGEHELGLRGGDALHLAIAQRSGATLCTLDTKQASAGAVLGVQTLLA